MSFLINGGIPEGDLPVKAPSGASNIRYVEGGKSYSSPMPDIVTATEQMQAAIDGIVASTEAQANSLLDSLGYTPPVAYSSGISITYTNQTVEYNGNIYAPKSADIPFTTSGTFEADKFRLVLQGTFQQSGVGAVIRTFQDRGRDVVTIKDYGVIGDGIADDTAAIIAAVSATNTSGKWLDWLDCTCRVTSSLSFSLSHMRWTASGARIVIDTPGDVTIGLLVTLADGADHRLLGGGLEVDAAGKCHIGVRFLQVQSTQTASIRLEGIAAKNVQMQVGAGQGAAGISVRGGFGSVELVDPRAENCMIRTGAGTPGSSGISGIQVVNHNTSGSYSKRINILRPKIRRVYSQDAAYNYDMDGIAVFANPFVDDTHGPSSLEVTSSDIQGCWGRDIKTQVAFTKIDSPTSVIDEGPSGGMIHPAYHIQAGPGLVVGGEYTVSGVTRSLAATICSFSKGASNWRSGTVHIDPSATVNAVVSVDQIANFSKTTTAVSDITVYGDSTYFGVLFTNGNEIDALNLDGVACDSLGVALVRVSSASGGAAPYRGVVTSRRCTNLGAVVPTVHKNIAGLAASCRLDDDGGFGFGPMSTSDISSSSFATGISTILAGVRGSGETNSGSQKIVSLALPDGVPVLFGESHGYSNTYIAEIVIGQGRVSYAILAVDFSGAGVISKGTAVEVGSTTDPGTGTYRIWHAGSGNLMLLNTSGNTRYATIRLFG